jgi:hypothetical protein
MGHKRFAPICTLAGVFSLGKMYRSCANFALEGPPILTFRRHKQSAWAKAQGFTKFYYGENIKILDLKIYLMVIFIL